MSIAMRVNSDGSGITIGDATPSANKLQVYDKTSLEIINSGENANILSFLRTNRSSWRIMNQNGHLYFQNNWANDAATDWFNTLYISNNSGNVYVTKGSLNLNTPLGISSGGTNAQNRATAIKNILQTDKNIIGSTSDDTITNWGSQGHCVTFYDVDGSINNQPSRYGILLNLAVDAAEVHQMWFWQPTGTIYHRGGNATGWDGTWRAVLDSENLYNWIKCGTSSTPSGSKYGIYIQY